MLQVRTKFLNGGPARNSVFAVGSLWRDDYYLSSEKPKEVSKGGQKVPNLIA